MGNRWCKTPSRTWRRGFDGVMLLTLGTDSIISSESYKKPGTMSLRDRKGLGPVLIHITLVVATGPSLHNIADCVCLRGCCLARLREVEPNSAQVYGCAKPFHACRGKRCLCVSREFSPGHCQILCYLLVRLKGTLHAGSPCRAQNELTEVLSYLFSNRLHASPDL